MHERLDAIDWKILKELQDDGRITNVELARRVGISAPPCLRRVRALEESGFIKGYRALLDEKALGYEVTVFAMVHLSSQAEADLKQFEDFVRKEPLVRECWMLSGEIDFVLTLGTVRIPLEVKYQRRIDPLRDTEGMRTFMEKAVNNAPFGLLITQSPVTLADPRIIPVPLSTLLLLR